MTLRMHPTHVDLNESARAALVTTLNTNLASSLDLFTQVKQAHWNIKGPQFFARHELFDKLADNLRGWSDTIAERASTLGGYAGGTLRLANERTKLPEYDLDAVKGTQHIRALVSRYETYCRELRRGIAQARELGDPPTEDLFIEVLRGAELDLWFLESHLNGDL